jgi:hypothetical protein
MSAIKKFPGGSFVETFSDLNRLENQLQLEARLAALTEASTSAQKIIQDGKIDWPGTRATLVDYVYGAFESGKISKVHNYIELAQWTADRCTIRGKALNPNSFRAMLSQKRTRKPAKFSTGV